jgi:serine/threonine protein phosphatase PrpC
VLMLCTDGLINMVKESEIKEEFRRGGSSADIAHRLIDRANENGGKDNITVIVARINPTLGQRFATFFRKHGMKLIWTLATLLFGVACFAAGYWIRGVKP